MEDGPGTHRCVGSPNDNEGRFLSRATTLRKLACRNDGIADWVPDDSGMTVKVPYLVTFAVGGVARVGGAAGGAVGGFLLRKLLRGMS